MRRAYGGFGRAAAPARALLQRFHLILLLGLAAALMAIDRADLEAARTLRAAIADMAAPLLDAVSRPIETANAAVAEVRRATALHAENAELRETVGRLEIWRERALRLERENAALRRMTRFAAAAPPWFVTARAVGDSGSPFVRTLLVNAGARDGVQPNQAALARGALAGRVVGVGRRSARILLLTDIGSRVPVAFEDTRERAILAGDNSAAPLLVHFRPGAEIALGQRLVTSGDGGALPPDLPVGVIVGISDSAVRVRPLADLGRIDHVQLLGWAPPAIEAPAEPLPAPPGGAARGGTTDRGPAERGGMDRAL